RRSLRISDHGAWRRPMAQRCTEAYGASSLPGERQGHCRIIWHHPRRRARKDRKSAWQLTLFSRRRAWWEGAAVGSLQVLSWTQFLVQESMVSLAENLLQL